MQTTETNTKRTETEYTTLKNIPKMTISALHYYAGKAKFSQGNGSNYSPMLENRIIALEKEILKAEQ